MLPTAASLVHLKSSLLLLLLLKGQILGIGALSQHKLLLLDRIRE